MKNTRYLKDKKKVSAQGESLCIFYLKGFKIQNIKECNIKVHIQNVLTKWHWPERPPSRSHPVGHGKSVTSSMCNTVDFLSVCCGIQSGTLCRSGFLDSSAFIVECYTELVSEFFNIYSGTLY